MKRSNPSGYGEVWIVYDPLFGDGGKAKVVDTLTKDPRIGAVVRFQGGANAGHTVVIGGKKVALHLIPAGVFRSNEGQPILSVLGRGVVASPERLFAEIEELEKHGIRITPDNLRISAGMQLTLQYHLRLEQAREASPGRKHTTVRAVSQTYALARLYQGIRAGDVKHIDRVRREITEPLAYANAVIHHHFGQPKVTIDEVMAEIETYRDRILPFLCDEITLLNELVQQGRVVLCEGAQSIMLDPDLGIYPHSTSSNTGPAAIEHGCGLCSDLITRRIAVVKAYITRVGIGHLVGELHDERAELIRKVGLEYGATSGRPRRIGRPDDVIAKHAARITHPTELVVTKADVLTGIPMEFCTGYQNGASSPLLTFPICAADLEECRPILEDAPKWEEDIRGLTDWADLPPNAQAYLERIRKPFDCPISMVSTGPGREEIIVLK